MWASTLCPFSSSTRNIALGRGSTTVPSTRIVSSLGLATVHHRGSGRAKGARKYHSWGDRQGYNAKGSEGKPGRNQLSGLRRPRRLHANTPTTARIPAANPAAPTTNITSRFVPSSDEAGAVGGAVGGVGAVRSVGAGPLRVSGVGALAPQGATSWRSGFAPAKSFPSTVTWQTRSRETAGTPSTRWRFPRI